MSLITSLFTVGSASAAGVNRAWCRPLHKTNCAYTSGGSSCCVCVPSTATCYIIEMWGQGGGGAGACCCMGSCFGGQAGAYGWIACTTSNQTHTMCICACVCSCRSCDAGVHAGHPGQFGRICDCSVGDLWCIIGGCGGSTCCNNMNGQGQYGACGIAWERYPAHTNQAINCCCFGHGWGTFACTMTDNGSTDFSTQGLCLGDPRTNYFSLSAWQPFQQIQGTTAYGCSCACCLCFDFLVCGGCGWSSPDMWVCYASDQTNWYNRPMCAYCGTGIGWGGGSAYAGGAGQCCRCQMTSPGYWGGYDGNFPGGGGSSAGMPNGPGGCCSGSCGGYSLILISWS
jgi:hypothetical protein